jgi:hypothetical protein
VIGHYKACSAKAGVFLRLELRTLLGELVDCALVLPDIIGVSGPGDAEGIARVLPPLQARQGLPRRRRGWDVSVMAPASCSRKIPMICSSVNRQQPCRLA